MGRINKYNSTHLTDWQIANAFPSECKKHYGVRFRALKIILLEWFDNIERIREDYIDDFERNFFIEMNWIMMPREERDRFGRYNKILNMCNMLNRHKKNNGTELNIDIAKSIPIQDLYNFEKVKHHHKYDVSLCPFHSEDTPSFYIYKDSNRYYCFGCNCHGDSIDFISRIKGLNFVDSVKYLMGVI